MKFKKLITLASLVGLIVFLATTVVACGSKSENTETKTAQVEKNKEKEKKEALDKAMIKVLTFLTMLWKKNCWKKTFLKRL